MKHLCGCGGALVLKIHQRKEEVDDIHSTETPRPVCVAVCVLAGQSWMCVVIGVFVQC